MGGVTIVAGETEHNKRTPPEGARDITSHRVTRWCMGIDRIRAYYARVPETERFCSPEGQLEFERTKLVMALFL
jgi:hypothetical protein